MNLGVYIATITALGLNFVWNPQVVFITAFMSVFALVIALSKDLPDIEGDTVFGVKTFALRIGAGMLTKIVVGLLGMNYLGAMGVAVFGLKSWGFRRGVLGIGHGILGGWLLWKVGKVDTGSKKGLQEFYKFIWSLFYAEYMLYPFI